MKKKKFDKKEEKIEDKVEENISTIPTDSKVDDVIDSVVKEQPKAGNFNKGKYHKGKGKGGRSNGYDKKDKGRGRDAKTQTKKSPRGQTSKGSASFTTAFEASVTLNPQNEIASFRDVATVGANRVTMEPGKQIEDIILSSGPDIIKPAFREGQDRSFQIGALSQIKKIMKQDPVVKPIVNPEIGDAVVYENTATIQKSLSMKQIDYSTGTITKNGQRTDKGVTESMIPTNMRFNNPIAPGEIKGEVFVAPIKGYNPVKVDDSNNDIRNAYLRTAKTVKRTKPIDKSVTITKSAQANKVILTGGTSDEFKSMDIGVIDTSKTTAPDYKEPRQVAHQLAVRNTIKVFRDKYNKKANSPFTRVSDPVEIKTAIEFTMDMKTFAHLFRDFFFHAINFAPIKKAKVGYTEPNVYHYHEGTLSSSGAFSSEIAKINRWVDSIPGYANKQVIERVRSMSRPSTMNTRENYHVLNPMIERYVAFAHDIDFESDSSVNPVDMVHPVQAHLAESEMYMPHGNMLKEFFKKFHTELLKQKTRALRTGVDKTDSKNPYAYISRTTITGFMFNIAKNIDSIIQWTNQVINEVDEFYDTMIKDDIADSRFYITTVPQDPFGPKRDGQIMDLRNKLQTKLEFIKPIYISSVWKVQPFRMDAKANPSDPAKPSTLLLGPVAIQQDNSDVDKSTVLGKVTPFFYTNLQFFESPWFIPYNLDDVLYNLTVPIITKERTHNNFFPVPTMKNFDNQLSTLEIMQQFRFLDTSFYPMPFSSSVGSDKIFIGSGDDDKTIDLQAGVGTFEQPYVSWYEKTSYVKALNFEISRNNAYQGYKNLSDVRVYISGGELVKAGMPLKSSDFNDEVTKGGLSVIYGKLIRKLGIPYADTLDSSSNQDDFSVIEDYLRTFQQSADIDLWPYVSKHMVMAESADAVSEDLELSAFPEIKSDGFSSR